MNCHSSQTSSATSFICVSCGGDLPLERAAWDVNPEIPTTLCLNCVDLEAMPAPEFAREVL